jgi:D-3-phosphoglycerate dehydrogenase
MPEYDYRVLVAEKISKEGVDKLKAMFYVDAYDRMERDQLLSDIGNYDALVVRSGTNVDAEVIERADRMMIIGRAGIGVDNIDVDAASKKGIMVANVPESNIISAAEHTIAMMMALARNIPAANNSLAKGEWKRSEYQGVELYGKTLGILGLGRIGALVAERADAFGMKIIGFDPLVAAAKAKQLGVEMKSSLDEVLSESDFLTLHVPKTKDTYHLIGMPELTKMKKSSRLVNVSRGGVVDEDALIEALEKGIIAGAALDVFECEPPCDSRLCTMEGVVATPHLGASTSEAQYKAGVAIADQIIAGLTGGVVSGAVNIRMPHREVVEALRPYMPLCEKLGGLVVNLVPGAVEEIEVEIVGEISEQDTSLLTMAFLKGFLENISTTPVTYVNAPLLARERGISVRESKSRQSRDYLNQIVATACDGGEKVRAGATIVGKSQEMFVNVLDFQIEIEPCQYMAFITYSDRPGMIGKVGTVMGAHDINIASLQVGRTKVDDFAGMGLCLDSPLTPAILEVLTAEEGIEKAKFIVL